MFAFTIDETIMSSNKENIHLLPWLGCDTYDELNYESSESNIDDEIELIDMTKTHGFVNCETESSDENDLNSTSDIADQVVYFRTVLNLLIHV